MKKIAIIMLCFLAFGMKAQVKDYVGKWELTKIVHVSGDTELVKKSDPRFINYNFEFNNTFTSFIKEKNEEVTGRWGYEFKTKTIKIKNPVLTKTKNAIGDWDMVIYLVTPAFFAEQRPAAKKKQFEYYIYSRVK